MIRKRQWRQGFTLIELLISMALMIIAMGVLIVFQRDLFSVNDFLTQSFSYQLAAEETIRDITRELRSASPSSLGGYPIQYADPFNIAFYSNVDSDVLKERVQYFVDQGQLKKSVTKPAGAILTYSTTTASETLRIVLRDVMATTSQPMFSYFDASYAGTSTPLTPPIDILSIRNIGIYLSLDDDTTLSPGAIEVETNVTVRNFLHQ